ncbi:MAG: NUDIX hydrolase [Actinomycetota bacterium]
MAPQQDLVARLRARLQPDERVAGPEDDDPVAAPERTWAGEDALGPPAAAAVLIPVVDGPGGPAVVLTRRARGLRAHRGEVSFPGGRVDPGESDREAALREAHEELGIDPGAVDVLGHLRRVHTVVSGYLITPWVGVIAPSQFVPNPAEIAVVIEAPLPVLLAPGTRRDQRFIRKGHMRLSPAFDVGAHVVWGATGRILDTLLGLLGDPDPPGAGDDRGGRR